MSVVPNRKVLKNVLSKLKAKTVTSKRRFNESSEHKEKLFETVLKTLEKSDLKEMKVPDVLDIISRLRISFLGFVMEVIRLIEEYELYIESLENHSSELDKAFWKGIEKKSKELIQQIEKQEKVKKEQNPFSA